jgi:hypothetical protein
MRGDSMATAEPIITMSRAARLSGLNPVALRRLVLSRRIASVKVGAVHRVRLSAVLAFLVECPSAA